MLHLHVKMTSYIIYDLNSYSLPESYCFQVGGKWKSDFLLFHETGKVAEYCYIEYPSKSFPPSKLKVRMIVNNSEKKNIEKCSIVIDNKKGLNQGSLEFKGEKCRYNFEWCLFRSRTDSKFFDLKVLVNFDSRFSSFFSFSSDTKQIYKDLGRLLTLRTDGNIFEVHDLVVKIGNQMTLFLSNLSKLLQEHASNKNVQYLNQYGLVLFEKIVFLMQVIKKEMKQFNEEKKKIEEKYNIPTPKKSASVANGNSGKIKPNFKVIKSRSLKGVDVGEGEKPKVEENKRIPKKGNKHLKPKKEKVKPSLTKNEEKFLNVKYQGPRKKQEEIEKGKRDEKKKQKKKRNLSFLKNLIPNFKKMFEGGGDKKKKNKKSEEETKETPIQKKKKDWIFQQEEEDNGWTVLSPSTGEFSEAKIVADDNEI